MKPVELSDLKALTEAVLDDNGNLARLVKEIREVSPCGLMEGTRVAISVLRELSKEQYPGASAMLLDFKHSHPNFM